ncbi:hypothetical protein WJX77_003254 [Trebouxia sp. C0004]
MIEHRCMMHGFALTMGSVFGHKAQIADLKKAAAYKHLTWLVQAATTRFTSVYNCMRFVLHLETALRNVVSNNRQQLTNRDASERQKALVKVVEDRAFWSDLAVLTPVAEPFNKEVGCTSHNCDSLGLVPAPWLQGFVQQGWSVEGAKDEGYGLLCAPPMGPLRNRFNEDTVSKMGLVRSHNRVSPPEDVEFKPKEVKDPGPSKQRSKVAGADMGPVEVSDLDLYRAYNPAPSAQQSASQAEHPAAIDRTTDASAEGQGGNDEEAAAQTEEELEASLTAARELEAKEDMRFVANAETFTQMMLNIELEYDLASPIWEGEYVTTDTAPEIPALGQEDDAVPLDVDRDDLFAKLTQGM